MIDYIRQINASQSFKIKSEFNFLNFDDITTDVQDDEKAPEHIEIWAAVKIHYEGKVPDSYRALNFIIGDWVTENQKALTQVIHAKLKGHFSELYPDSDVSEITAETDSAIWEDQLDYMPRVDEEDKSILIEIELVLEAEPIED